jgi:hypothetical protein
VILSARLAFICHFQEIPVYSRIVRQLWMERTNENIFLSHEYVLLAVRRQRFDFLSDFRYFGRADENGMEWFLANRFNRDVFFEAVDLAAIRISPYRDVDEAESELARMIGDFPREDYHSRASAENRLAFQVEFPDRTNELVPEKELRYRRALPSWYDQAIDVFHVFRPFDRDRFHSQPVQHALVCMEIALEPEHAD